jgi:hypothetical protein
VVTTDFFWILVSFAVTYSNFLWQRKWNIQRFYKLWIYPLALYRAPISLEHIQFPQKRLNKIELATIHATIPQPHRTVNALLLSNNLCLHALIKKCQISELTIIALTISFWLFLSALMAFPRLTFACDITRSTSFSSTPVSSTSSSSDSSWIGATTYKKQIKQQNKKLFLVVCSLNLPFHRSLQISRT